MQKVITETVLIFGRSDFISEIEVQGLLKLGFTTFGINEQDFATDYNVFLDEPMAEKHLQFTGTIITQSRHAVRKPFVHYDYFDCDFTHDYLLNWLCGKCKKAVLIGCADFENNAHYNSDILFEPDQKAIERSIYFIENLSDLEVRKMNPNGILNIPIWRV